MHDGKLLAWVGRGGSSMVTFLPKDEPDASHAGKALGEALVGIARRRAHIAMLVTIDGMPAATGVGRARSQSGATFDARMALIAGTANVWRFMFVAPAGSLGRYDGDFQRTLASFDQLGAQEAASARPFRVRTVRVGETDTQESLAAAMATRDAPLRRFQVLNGLTEGARLQPGQLVKIIAD